MPLSFWTTAFRPSPRRRAPNDAASRLSQHHRNLSLWVLQTWLAMFYVGAGYAKLSQPQDMLVLLTTWPARVSPGQLHAIGWIEIALAVSVVTPLISWRIFRPILLTGAFGLLVDAGVMAVFHALERDAGLAVLNGLLVLMTLAVIAGRWPRQAQGPGGGSRAG